MGRDGFEFSAELWRHPGEDGWHFLTLPADLAAELRDLFAGAHRAFGSLPVDARIGTTSWPTSLFSDTRRGSYLLPVKAAVRRAERIGPGDEVRVYLHPR